MEMMFCSGDVTFGPCSAEELGRGTTPNNHETLHDTGVLATTIDIDFPSFLLLSALYTAAFRAHPA